MPLMVTVRPRLQYLNHSPITSTAIFPPTTAHLVITMFRAIRPLSLICMLLHSITFPIPRRGQVLLQVLHFRRVFFPCERRNVLETPRELFGS